MKTTLIAAIFLFCLLLKAPLALAHLPRLVDGDGPVEIKKPEVSQAFYAALEGKPGLYHIDTAGNLSLYVGLLVPELQDVCTDITAAVFSAPAGGAKKLLFTLDGESHRWEKYFEPFAGDRYLKGPETEKSVPPGRYRIEVSSPGNSGRYVLVVGREERFSLAETVEMIAVLPSLKRDFFGKSPLTAYFNLVGLFMFIALLLLFASVYGIYRLIKYVLEPRHT